MGMPALAKIVSTPGIVRNVRLFAKVYRERMSPVRAIIRATKVKRTLQTLRAVTLIDFTPVPLGVSIGPLNRMPYFSTAACASGVLRFCFPHELN